MKTLNGFFTSTKQTSVLNLSELSSVKGGDNPPTRPDDPFKKHKKRK